MTGVLLGVGLGAEIASRKWKEDLNFSVELVKNHPLQHFIVRNVSKDSPTSLTSFDRRHLHIVFGKDSHPADGV